MQRINKVYRINHPISRRFFSSKNNQSDFFAQAASTTISTIEALRDLAFPADQKRLQSDKEIMQEIIRSNHLAKKTMNEVGKGLSQNKEQSIFMKDYYQLHQMGLQGVET